jgi:hypothetical protein
MRRQTRQAPKESKGDHSKMKSLFFRAALMLAMGLFLSNSSVRAQDNQDQDAVGCSNATLSGNYAFTVSGQVFLPIPAVQNSYQIVQRQGVAMTNFDGLGGLSQVDFVLSDPNAPKPKGVPPTDQITGFHNDENGTYTVNKDCTGTFTIILPALLDPTTHQPVTGTGKIVVNFVLSDHGRAIHTIVTSIQPAGAPGPVPALIRSDGHKL